MVSAFGGNKAETTTMLPVIEVFMAAHGLPGVTVRAHGVRIEDISDLAGHSGTSVTETVYRTSTATR